MKRDHTYHNPLVRDGQSQSGRIIPALSPDYIKVDERDRDDLISFASEYSKLIQYYDEHNHRKGDWGDFFKEDTPADEPHYALFLAFTWLFGHLQQDLNTLTERHLNHYYKEILQLRHKPAKADTVHLLLELAKNAEQHMLQKGTLLKAGKDALGKDLFYAIDKDIVLNKAKVSSLKTIFQEPFFDQENKLKKVSGYGLYGAPVANSSNGLGADVDADNLNWKLLGASQVPEDPTMTKAEVGFAISSPILFLQEGSRKIRLEILLAKSLHPDFLPSFLTLPMFSITFSQEEVITLQELVTDVSLPEELSAEARAAIDKLAEALKSALKSEAQTAIQTDDNFLTIGNQPATENGKRLRKWWESLGLGLVNQDGTSQTDTIAPAKTFRAVLSMMDHYCALALRDAFVVSLSGAEEWIGPFVVDAQYQHSTLLALELGLTVEDPAVVAYQEELLTSGFGDSHPLLRVVLNSGEQYQYSILKNMRPISFNLKVDVEGIKNLVLQNDTANINPNKTFQPFGPQPGLNTNFYIGSEEVFQKDLSGLTLNIHWADLPDDLKEYYQAYTEDLKGYWDKQLEEQTAAIDQQGLEIIARLQSEELQKTWEKNPDKRDKDIAEAQQQAEALTARKNELTAARDKLSINATLFTCQFEMLNGGKWQSLTNLEAATEIPLFDRDVNSQRTIALKKAAAESPYKRPAKIREIKRLDNSTLNGFIKMELTGPSVGKFKGFGHSRFQQLYTEKIIEQLKPANADKDIALPNEPYTPAMAAISLDYQSELTIKVEEGKEEHEKIFQIHPFGVAESNLIDTQDQPLTVLPSIPGEGTLYIGFEHLSPAQNLSVLFQLNEKSVDHEFVGKVAVQWSYLNNNQWTDFDNTDILEDTTEVFTQSGIVTFQLPKNITNDNTLLPSGQYWIRAMVANNTLGVADAMKIAAQAVTASFVDHNNDPDHLATPLSPESIKKLKVSNSAIKSVTQAYPSFNGQLKEQSDTFYTRVSERLRHKRRGITIWDYEHIILEAFPRVYKVKCLNHYDPENSLCKKEMSPGAVTLIVLSRAAEETDVTRKLAPVTNVITLNAIKSLLTEITPPFIAARNKLFVQNPSYTRIKIDTGVKFREGLDIAYYKRQLQTDIMKLLSPWAFDESKPITFERKLYKSLIINYIEELHYVDFLCCFKVINMDATEDNPDDEEAQIISASGPANIIISHHEHSIFPVEGDTCDCEDLRAEEKKNEIIASGIGAMVIETDFEVA